MFFKFDNISFYFNNTSFIVKKNEEIDFYNYIFFIKKSKRFVDFNILDKTLTLFKSKILKLSLVYNHKLKQSDLYKILNKLEVQLKRLEKEDW